MGTETRQSSRPTTIALVRIYAFGQLRGLVPNEMPWQGGSRAEFVARLQRESPRAQPLLRVSLILVNGMPSDANTHVASGAQVQMLPPISGG